MHILHLNQRNQRSQISFQYLKDKKKKGKKKGSEKGGENSPISPPLDPPLDHHSHTHTHMLILLLFFLLRSRTNHVPEIRAMSPQAPSYIARNFIYVLMSILGTIDTRNISKKLQLKSLNIRGMFEGTQARQAALFVYFLGKKIKRPSVA